MKKNEAFSKCGMYRGDEEKKNFIIRLNKIEGQIRGVRQMIENDRSCDDVLIQVSSVIKGLNSFGNELLRDHLSTYVVEKMKNDQIEVVDEIVTLFGRLN